MYCIWILCHHYRTNHFLHHELIHAIAFTFFLLLLSFALSRPAAVLLSSNGAQWLNENFSSLFYYYFMRVHLIKRHRLFTLLTYHHHHRFVVCLTLLLLLLAKRMWEWLTIIERNSNSLCAFDRSFEWSPFHKTRTNITQHGLITHTHTWQRKRKNTQCHY